MADADPRPHETHAILEAVNEGMAILDAEGRIVQVNTALLRLTGAFAQDLIGLPVKQLFMRELTRHGMAHWSGMAIGRVNWLVQHAPQMLLALFDAAPLGVLEVDREGRILYANSMAHTLLMVEIGGLLGTPVAMRLPESMRARHEAQMAQWWAAPEERAMLDRRLPVLRGDGTQGLLEIGLARSANGRTFVWLADVALQPWSAFSRSAWGTFFVEAPSSQETEFDLQIKHFARRAKRLSGKEPDSFRRVLRDAMVGILWVDASDMIRFANPAAHALAGYGHGAFLMGEPLSLLIPPNLLAEGRRFSLWRADGTALAVVMNLCPVDTPDGEMTLVMLRDEADLPWSLIRETTFGLLFEKEEADEEEDAHQHRWLWVVNGPACPVLVSVARMAGSGFVLSLTDISTLHVREQAVRRERDFINQLFETMQEGVLVIDATGTITRANAKVCEMAGQEAHALLGMSLGALFDGAVMWRWLVSAHDGFMQAQYIQAPLRFWSFFWEMDAPALVFTQAGRVALANPAAERFLGYAERGLLDMSIAQFAAVADVARLRQGLQMALSPHAVKDIPLDMRVLNHAGQAVAVAGALLCPVRAEQGQVAVLCLMGMRTPALSASIGHIETFVTGPGGERRIVAVSGAPLRDAMGVMAGAVINIKDISELTAIKERAALQKQVAHQERLASIGQLAAGVAHDFNNLLGAIQGHAELTEAKVAKGIAVDKNLQGILQSTERARDLVKRLQMVHHDTGGGVGHFDLIPVLGEADTLLSASLRGIALRFEIEAVDQPCVVQGDAGEFQQVLLNLCINARYAMADRRDGRITVAIRRQGGRVQLSVADNGCGIPPENLPHIFDPFFTTREVGEGSGLGLAMVHGIVTRMGGSIACESTVGEGTRFVLSLPLGGLAPETMNKSLEASLSSSSGPLPG